MLVIAVIGYFRSANALHALIGREFPDAWRKTFARSSVWGDPMKVDAGDGLNQVILGWPWQLDVADARYKRLLLQARVYAVFSFCRWSQPLSPQS